MSAGGIFILVLLVIFVGWLIVVRPTRRRQLNREAMVDHLRVGDEILTAGGFFATVVRIDEDEVVVELSPGAEARLSKRAIAAVLPDEEGPTSDTSEVAAAPEPEPVETADRAPR